MHTVRLDDIGSLPASLRQDVEQLEPVLRRARTWDEARHQSDVVDAAQRVDDFVARSYVVGFHCTKELSSGLFKSRGLRPVDPAQHVGEFHAWLRTHAPAMANRFESTHQDWLSNPQLPSRAGSLHLFLSRHAITAENTWRFFTFFGGEMIYWPFEDREPSVELTYLEGIGTPALVEFQVPARGLQTHVETPFARTLIGSFASSFEPEFDADYGASATYAEVVPPSDVLAVHPPPPDVILEIAKPGAWRGPVV